MRVQTSANLKVDLKLTLMTHVKAMQYSLIQELEHQLNLASSMLN